MSEAAEPRVVLDVQGLSIRLPDGTLVVENVDLQLREGEVVSLLGPSGAGKTTLLRALVAPEELMRQGYVLGWTKHVVRVEPAFVPQRGALLDHLDVADNIRLASAGAAVQRDPLAWLEAVGLEPELGGRPVARLSGGQAQRVAVARTLAAERALIILDEPSVGLDALSVRRLSRFLHQQSRTHRVAVLVITHDLTLAAGSSDRFLFLDPSARALRDIHAEWLGPLDAMDTTEQNDTQQESASTDPSAETVARSVRNDRKAAFESQVEQHLAGVTVGHRAVQSPSWARSILVSVRSVFERRPSALAVAGMGVWRAFHPSMFRASMRVMLVAFIQAFVRPILFYCIVGMLLGYTVPYVIANISSDLKPDSALRLVGGTYILALAPPVATILYSATSGSAVSAWLGGLQLNRQVQALEGLGVPAERYLWAPAWVALVVGHLLVCVAFIASMVLGGRWLFDHYHVPDAVKVLTSDMLDPSPSRRPYLSRGIWLVGVYAVSVASLVVSRGAQPKEKTDDVTASMTASVVLSTLFVVVAELISVVALFSWTKR